MNIITSLNKAIKYLNIILIIQVNLIVVVIIVILLFLLLLKVNNILILMLYMLNLNHYKIRWIMEDLLNHILILRKRKIVIIKI